MIHTSNIYILVFSVTFSSIVCHLFPFSPPSGGSVSVEKIVSNQVSPLKQLERMGLGPSSGGGGNRDVVNIGMTPFYRSLPSRVVWSDIARMAQHKSKEDIEEDITNVDDGPDNLIDDGSHLTAEQMIQFLNNLAKHNSNFAVAREVKW